MLQSKESTALQNTADAKCSKIKAYGVHFITNQKSFLLLGHKQSQSPSWALVPFFFSGQITKSILFQKADLVMDIWSLSL